VSGTDPAASEPYAVLLSGRARRNIRENLPLEVALAAMETIDGSIAVNPYRAGKPLGVVTTDRRPVIRHDLTIRNARSPCEATTRIRSS